MKKIFFKYRFFAFVKLIVLQFVCLCTFAQQEISIIPKPVSTEKKNGFFNINSKTQILSATKQEMANAGFLDSYIKELTGIKLNAVITTAKAKNSIYLEIDSVKIRHHEGYMLEVSSTGIKITAADGSGLFYGLQSLIQLAHQSKIGTLIVPSCKIIDYPALPYRGMHLDVSRNMFSTATIKKWLDVLAFYKINTFHWHLTDDQGWRIEIKKYPELQLKSAWRNETLIGHKRAAPHRFDGKKYGGYYTQEEIKEIVAYAAARRINVIPEIEMPGHALAALSAYPNLGCTGGPYQTATYWGVFDDVFCAGNEETFSFLEGVLDEVMPLFPSTYIHIGGDECPKTRWKVCPKCQKRITDEKLKDEHELQSYFIKRMEKYVESKGKKIIGWDEILEGGISPGATIMSWRGEEGGIDAAKMKHNVIMTPEKYVYLDYYQSLNPDEPIGSGGYLPLRKIYNYDPVPSQLNAEEKKYIKGVQANVWSEYLANDQKAEYMMFPRVIALAEIGWSTKENRNYLDFLKRLDQQKAFIQNLNYAKRYYDINGKATLKAEYELQSDRPNAQIRYTLDGKNPTIKSALYRKAFTPAKSGSIKALTFVNGKAAGKIFEQYFNHHLALRKLVKLKSTPAANYNPGAGALVNGVQGTAFYNTGEWLGFSGDDFEAIVDLGTVQKISELSIGVLQYHWQRIWAPQNLRFEISLDAGNFRNIFETNNFPAEGINRIRTKIKTTAARYIKITAINKGLIPKGEYGEGGKALLMIDELTVN